MNHMKILKQRAERAKELGLLIYENEDNLDNWEGPSLIDDEAKMTELIKSKYSEHIESMNEVDLHLVYECVYEKNRYGRISFDQPLDRLINIEAKKIKKLFLKRLEEEIKK